GPESACRGAVTNQHTASFAPPMLVRATADHRGAALGLSGSPNSTHYEKMSELIDAGFVRKNKAGGIAPNVRGMVADELDGYGVDDATVVETYEQVLARVASA
ncbi:MAG: hypothetical protein ACNS61_05500, partial [Candidatus Wenzhouxiangella sp. M2_3B_020]